MKRGTVAGGLAVLTLLIVGTAIVVRFEEHPTADPPAASPAQARWVVSGGGSSPESNEISIEDDLRLATEVFDGPGVTLYANGRNTRAVRVENGELEQDPLVARLAALFNPRSGRRSVYQSATIEADGASTPAKLLSVVREAAASPGLPLLVYLAGHGDRGERANDNAIVMWANRSVSPIDLAEAVGSGARQTRFVITTCFSGGFAELAFERADEDAGPVHADICGLFASTWDREAGGCDPDPDRGRHDGYGVHFLSALDGKKRDGTPLPSDLLDIDGDGRVSLLDAHTFARLSSKSIDVPTTTSERWLRSVVELDADAPPTVLAHEDAVIGVFGKHLAAMTEALARAKLEAIDQKLDTVADVEVVAAKTETEAFWDASAAILAQWPVLDDPWHPLWNRVFEANRSEIDRFMASSREIAALDQAVVVTDRAAGERAALEVERAPLHRLLRAFETKRLASVLAQRGGVDWDRYVKLRACENTQP